MTLLAFILSLLFAGLGALGVASPSRLLDVVRRIQTRAGLYLAAGLRVALGAALLFAAPSSRAPEVLHILAIVMLVAGLITPLFGLERFRRLLAWWSSRGSGFIRVWAAFALTFGLWLAYAVIPQTSR